MCLNFLLCITTIKVCKRINKLKRHTGLLCSLKYLMSNPVAYYFFKFWNLVLLMDSSTIINFSHFGTPVLLICILIIIPLNCLFLGIWSLLLLFDPGTIINFGSLVLLLYRYYYSILQSTFSEPSHPKLLFAGFILKCHISDKGLVFSCSVYMCHGYDLEGKTYTHTLRQSKSFKTTLVYMTMLSFHYVLAFC